MRCCASKRSTSTRSEAGAPETPRACPDEGVAAAMPAVKETHLHQSIRVVDSDDEPAGWPGTDPCTSDDGAARTSTSAFAEGCVAVDAREVARSIAAELLTKRAHDRRDVFSVRRSGTDASSAHVSSDDFEFDPEVGTGAESGGDTVTEPDETTSLLESVSCRTHRTASTREFGVNTDGDDERRRRRAVTPATAVLLTACAVAGCTLYALDPMNVAGALAGHSWRARAADADPDLAVESAEPTAKAARTKTATRTKTAVSHRAVSHRREENGGVRHVVPRDLFAKALAKALDERRLSGDAPDDDERATSHRAGASHRATTKERASRSAHGVASRASKRRPDTTREKDAEKTSGSDASVSRLGHVHRATSHRATSHRATSHHRAAARVVGACAANVPARDARRGRFQFEDASCGGTRHHRGRREGCASVGLPPGRDDRSSLDASSTSGCRFCVLHGSAREDDEDGYDGDDDYLPMLDPLAWSVRYEACPRDVCVTRGLRAALCDPD